MRHLHAAPQAILRCRGRCEPFYFDLFFAAVLIFFYLLLFTTYGRRFKWEPIFVRRVLPVLIYDLMFFSLYCESYF